MRTLNRPMFNMGGPIKQGIMHGIREPLQKGNIAKGIFSKVGKLFGGDTGWWSKIRPTGKFRETPGKYHGYGQYTGPVWGKPGKKTAWEIAKSPSLMWKGIKENPYWAGVGGVYGGPAAVGLGVDIVKGPGWSGVKQAADLAVPDWLYDQDKHLAEIAARKKAAEEKVEPIVTPYLESKGKTTELTAAQKEKWADAQRGKRLNNLLDIMGYDRSKKTAVADALIDASKIVSDRGTLDTKNITSELINPAIQAFSKRLDKPEQIREAVGLMMAKGEIEKDLYKWKPGTHLKNAQDMADTLKIPLSEALNMVTGKANTLGEELAANQTAKRNPLVASEVEQLTRTWADKKNKKLQKTYTATDIKEGGLGEMDAIEIVSKGIKGPQDDGLYVVGTEVIEVINGVPKRKW